MVGHLEASVLKNPKKGEEELVWPSSDAWSSKKKQRREKDIQYVNGVYIECGSAAIHRRNMEMQKIFSSKDNRGDVREEEFQEKIREKVKRIDRENIEALLKD